MAIKKRNVKRDELKIKEPGIIDKYLDLVEKNEKVFIVFPFLFFFFLPFVMDKFASFVLSVYTIVFVVITFILLQNQSSSIEQDDVCGLHDLDKNPKGDKYLLFGYSVDDIKDIPDPAVVMKEQRHVLNYPIFIDRDFTLRHGLIVGTTGSGKTVLIRCLLSQVLTSGGGVMIVDGKADQLTYEDFYNTTVAFNREDDFYMLNLSEPSESHTMNPLMSGGVDDIAEMLSNMLGEGGGDNQYWIERGQILMKSLLSILIPLRDRGELFAPNGDKRGKPANGLSFTLLSKWMGFNELYDLYHLIKEENKQYPEDDPKWIELKRMESYIMSNGGNVQEKAEIPPEAIKQHGFAMSQWTSSMDTLMGTYGEVFDTQTPDIDMLDIIVGGRVLYVMLPALRKSESTLSQLGKLVLANLKISLVALLGDKISGSKEERYSGFAARPRVPFLGIMDEYGAYAVKGFDNVLAQARSLQVGIVIAVQELASLEKADDIEKKRILGNTAWKVALKMTEDETIESFMKIAGKEDVAVANLTNEEENKLSYNVQEKDLLDPLVLKRLKGGQGFSIINGKLSPMLVAFYEPAVCSVIPKFSNSRAAYIGKSVLRSDFIPQVSKIEEEYKVLKIKKELNKDVDFPAYSKEERKILYEDLLSQDKIKNIIDFDLNFNNKLLTDFENYVKLNNFDIEKITEDLNKNILKLDQILEKYI